MDSSSPSTTTAPTPAPASTNQPSQNKKKRKSPSQLALLHKRIRHNLITCPVAISILRDIGLRSRSTLNSANFLAWTVDPTDPIFQTIHSYVSNGQPGKTFAPWHTRQFGTKILGILRITPGGIPPQFNDNPENRGQLRMMLWKGCRPIDARNTLKKGLKVEKEAPGAKWGVGYYFSDRIDDALEWCWDMRFASNGETLKDVFQAGNIAYLFLCEVMLGNDVYLTYTEEPKGPVVTPKQSLWARLTRQTPAETNVKSIKCQSDWTPDPLGNVEIDGCVWPMGESIIDWKARRVRSNFYANQYIVYDESQVIPRYLVKVEITQGLTKEKIC